MCVQNFSGVPRDMDMLCFKRKPRVGPSINSTLVTVMIACAASATGVLHAQDTASETTIRAIVADQAVAWNAGDGEGYARHVGPDVSFTNLFGMVISRHLMSPSCSSVEAAGGGSTRITTSTSSRRSDAGNFPSDFHRATPTDAVLQTFVLTGQLRARSR